MSTEKTALDTLERLWAWLLGSGVFFTVLWFAFTEFWTGLFNALGEWIATKILNKKKIDHLKDKAARADERGVLHKYVADELYRVNKRLDECDKRHQDRDRLDDEREKKLARCQERREELEIKAVRFINEARAAAIENAKLMAENSSLRGKLGRG